MGRERRDLPPLNALRAFEAAARHGSFKNAADELGVTHGAISRHVGLLEDWLGPPGLFDRYNRRVVLTAAGAALLEACGPALDRLAHGTRRHRDRRGAVSGTTLQVNALASFSLRWLLPRLATFREEHPDVEVRLTTSNDPVDAVREPFDVIIRGGPDAFHGFSARPFLPERRLPVCSPEVLGGVPPLEIAELSRHTLLHVTSMPRLWSDWVQAAGGQMFEAETSLVFDHFYLAVQAAIDGLGIAIGPTALVADDLASGRLVAPFPGISLPARGYHAYVPAHRADDAAVKLFCDWLEAAGSRS